MNARTAALFLAVALLFGAVAAQDARATSPLGGCGDEEEERDPNATGGNNGTASPSPSPSPSSRGCFEVVVMTPNGPCSVVRKVGDRPAVDFSPILGMIEVDPDQCVQRAVQKAANVGTANNDPALIVTET